MTSRTVDKVFRGQPTSDGAGVQLVRMIGQPALMDLDPFLLLDNFRSDDPQDYIAGFPPHPHRGFETVTHLLHGRMRHRDNAGNEGVIEAGGIQWMTAGRGIVHSEMPEQEDGLLSGFQLWINLPASHKMTAPSYQEHPVDGIPVEQREGAVVRVITGTTSTGTTGPVTQPLTEPLYIDVSLQAGATFTETLPAEHTAFVHLVEGSLEMTGEDGSEVTLHADELAVLGHGEQITIKGGRQDSRFLLIAGKPLNEPVARHGPFVMNTQEELRQAFGDYQAGKF